MDAYTEQVPATSDPETVYAPGPVITNTNPPDDPDWVSEIFAKQLHLAPPVDLPRGSLTCAAQNQSGPSFNWYAANVSIISPVAWYDFADGEPIQGQHHGFLWQWNQHYRRWYQHELYAT